jgi:methanogen homocitrate synthase
MPNCSAGATPADDGAVVRFYDSTLRDGEQMPGVSFSLDRRLEIARALDDLGLDAIETGFAASGPRQRADMAAVARLGLRTTLLSLARPTRSDVDAACEAAVDGVVLVSTASEYQLRYKLQREAQAVLEETCDAVRHARSVDLFVQVSFEDATRTEPEVLCASAKQAVAAGAQRIGLADTVGVGYPATMRDLVAQVVGAVNVPVAVHCHDDFGMAVANSLAAVEGGASYLSTTVNGIGERAGNASTEECALAVEVLLGRRTNLDLAKLNEVCQLVSTHAGVPIPANKAVCGTNAFRHESGIHVSAVLRNPACYEPYDPALVGARRELVLGKTSGRAAVRNFVRQLGADGDGAPVDDETCRLVLDELKARAERRESIDASTLREILTSLEA